MTRLTFAALPTLSQGGVLQLSKHARHWQVKVLCLKRCRYIGTVCNDRTEYRYIELSSLQKLQAVLVSLCESVAAKSTWQIVLTCSPDWRAGNFACRTTRLYGVLLLLEVSAAEAY